MFFDLVSCCTIEGIINNCDRDWTTHHQITDELNLYYLETILRERDLEYIRQNLISSSVTSTTTTSTTTAIEKKVVYIPTKARSLAMVVSIIMSRF